MPKFDLTTVELGDPATRLLTVEEAATEILLALPVTPPETVPLSDALGRVAAQNVTARLNHPPAPVSAMDGYALFSRDVRELPARLRKIGVSRAGMPFRGELVPGTCVRIFTGGVIPAGADLIALQEDVLATEDLVHIRAVPKVSQYIRQAGLDVMVGQTCVRAGHRITARDIGVLATTGHHSVAVRRRPTVAILSTGDELVAPGVTPQEGQIVNANGVALAAAVAAWGGAPLDLGIARDRAEAVADAVDRAAGADILVTSGGVSVGDHDLVQKGLARRRFTPDFWRIAMRPGKPLMFGYIDTLPVLGLPGNPVSALVCALLFLRPVLRRMQGEPAPFPKLEQAVLQAPMAANDSREDYVRAQLDIAPDGRLLALPFPKQDSAMLMTLASADGLIRRPVSAPPVEKGETVQVVRFDSAGLF